MNVTRKDILKIVALYFFIGIVWDSLSTDFLELVGLHSDTIQYIHLVDDLFIITLSSIILIFITFRQIKKDEQRELEIFTVLKNYEEIFNSTKDAIIIFDFVTEKILNANRAFLKLFEYENEDLKNLTYSDLSSSDYANLIQQFYKIFNAAKEGKETIFEWKNKSKNGVEFWTENSIKIAEIDGEKRVIIVTREVGARKKAELELERSNLFLNTVLQNAPTGIQFIENTIDNMKLLFTNKVGREILGLHREGQKLISDVKENLLNNFRLEIFDVEGNEIPKGDSFVSRLIKYKEENRKINTEFYFYKEDGEKIYIRADAVNVKKEDGSIIGSLAIFSDVTTYKKNKEEIRKSEQRYRSLVENAPEGIIVYDVLKDKIVDFNDKAVSIFEYPSEESKGKSFTEFSPKFQPNGELSEELGIKLLRKVLKGEIIRTEWVF